MASPGDLDLTLKGSTEGGRVLKIKFHSFNLGLQFGFDPMRFEPDSRLQYQAVAIVKQVDQFTPLLAYALVQRLRFETAEFRFLRPSSPSDSTPDHFFTIALENGRIVGLNQKSTDKLAGDEEDDGRPMLEEVSFSFRRIYWTDTSKRIGSQLRLRPWQPKPWWKRFLPSRRPPPPRQMP